jgi:Leucine-rich repeat (LRR) protein
VHWTREFAAEVLSISTAYEIPVEKNGFNSIPPLSQLRSLKNLSLNNYEGSDYTFLDGLSSLETLELSHCHELVELPKAIKTLTKLSEIKIFMCDQFSKLNRQLENLSFLKKLYIYCDDLDADQFEEIAKLNQLEDLTIRVGWNKEPKILEIPPSITKLKKLKILELKLGNVKELPEFIDQLKNIEELYLNDFNSIKTLPASLIHLPKLKKLAIPTSIECLPNELRKLNLDTLILWTSKFAGSNVKQEVYSILVGPKTKFKRNRD